MNTDSLVKEDEEQRDRPRPANWPFFSAKNVTILGYRRKYVHARGGSGCFF